MLTGECVQLDLPSSHKYLSVVSHTIEDMLHKAGEHPDVIYNITLGVQEACANIVDHAHCDRPAARIHVSLRLVETPHQFVVQLTDQGEPFDVSIRPNIDLNRERVRGYGLYLMHELMDEIRYESYPDHNICTLIKHL